MKKSKITQRDLSREEISLKEFLEDTGIKVDDYYELSDDSAIALLTNLEEKQKQILISAGLKDLGYDIFYLETSKVSVNKEFHHLEQIYIKTETTKWGEIIEKITEIENKCSSEGKECPLRSSIKQLQTTFKWKGTLARDKLSFNDFVTDLYGFFIDNLRDNGKKHAENDFLKITRALRHGYSHDTTTWGEDARIQNAQTQQGFYQGVLNKDTPKSNFNFVLCQLRLLDLCLEFLNLLQRWPENEIIC